MVRAARRSRLCALVASLAAIAGVAHAMGGHFDVDDATVLAPQRCQLELWSLRSDAVRVHHIGPACRVGAAELGLTLDQQSASGAERSRSAGMQVKLVADPLVAPISAGVVGGVVHAWMPRRVTGYTAYVPVSWVATDTLQAHANVGIEGTSDGRHSGRRGAAVEWAPHERGSVLVERIKLLGVWRSRAGLRWAASERTSFDVSIDRVRGASGWGAGLTHEFELRR